MNEAQRFMRYVLPGLACVGSLLFFLGLSHTHYLAYLLTQKGDKWIGLALGTFLASGALGYVLSTIYFSLRWAPGIHRFASVDNSRLIRTAHQTLSLEIQRNTGGKLVALTLDEVENLPRRQKWAVVTAFWASCIDGRKGAKSNLSEYDERLVGTIHSLGATLVGAVMAFVLWSLIAHAHPPAATELLSVRWCQVGFAALTVSTATSFYIAMRSHEGMAFSWCMGMLGDLKAESPTHSPYVIVIDAN